MIHIHKVFIISKLLERSLKTTTSYLEGDEHMINEIKVLQSGPENENGYDLLIKTENSDFLYKNISENKNLLEKLRMRMLKDDIATVHLNDIIRDFIIENAINRLSENCLF